MNNILVFLPKDFLSYSKFERKLSKITSALESYELSGPQDPNGFLNQYAESNSQCKKLMIQPEWQSLPYTHAVLFDDGEEFPNELSQLQEKKIPLRKIKIKITRVVNIHFQPEFQNIKKTDSYEYIGRGSKWGNPYSMFGEDHESRDEVINKFKYDFDKNILMKAKKEDAHSLAGKRLGCFCKPHACHGDVIANFLNSFDDEL